ncbi:uncharacterized protein M6B38_199855 [Iris pallida]|uniref:Uncharacterized protein n=1 Tax=Iris pallida TaxID=29817 RepID=A0AAX6EAQ6_IRIPA|nr:uncharacterized protein M6B38_199855 [Iris pallida]
MLSLKLLNGVTSFSSLRSKKNPFPSPSPFTPPPFFFFFGPKSAKSPFTPLNYQFGGVDSPSQEAKGTEKKEARGGGGEETRREEEEPIDGVHVPRQKYISVPKSDLLDALLSTFDSREDADEFARVSVCLDSILHAEHKGVLEKMRIYYSLSHSPEQETTTAYSSTNEKEAISNEHISFDGSADSENIGTNCSGDVEGDKSLFFQNSLDLRELFESFNGSTSRKSVVDSSCRVAVATDFQRSFMKLLHDAQFEELSREDLMMTYALNSDYLLTLPIYVDWKKASKSNAIIFRRGYATERQRGLLVVEKLDYLQSKLLQEIFFSLSRPLKMIGSWLSKALKSSKEAQGIDKWIESVKLWLKEQYSLEGMLSIGEKKSGNMKYDQILESDLPIWIAAQRALPLYEGLLSSAGPRGRLIRKLLNWIGILPSPAEASTDFFSDTKQSDSYMRSNFLPRITLRNLWEPATREYCENNVWKMLKTSVSILFSQSTLQEPAFQELILLYNEKTSQSKINGRAEVQPLQLKIYEKIPIPDLAVIFPHKKLSFRILDSVRLDIATIVGLLAYFVNYKFENIPSSPSAVLLDVIAVSALIIYVSRVVLGYKQTWDRYQLLVNRTLYEKTLASGFGSVHFLLDASEQQQYKEAILVYAILLHSEKYQASSPKRIGVACETFIYEKFKKKIEMPIDKAIKTLQRLDLANEFDPDGISIKLKAIPCTKAYETLKCRWDSLLGQE